MLVEVLLRHHQHATRSRARIVDLHALLGLDDAHQHADYRARRVEFAALLAGRVGKIPDQVLVRRAEQIGELEVLVAQPHLREMHDEIAQPLVRQRRLADLLRKIDVPEHAFEARVLVLQRSERLVQPVPDVLGTSSRRNDQRASGGTKNEPV